MEARTATATQSIGYDEEGGRFHLAGLNAQALPCFPLLQELIRNGHLGGAVLTVEGILTLDNAGVGTLAHSLRSLTEGQSNIQIGYCRILNGSILHRGMLKADGTGSNNDIAGLYIQVNTATGTYADKGICANVVELFHCDRSRGTADTGGADTDLLTQKGAGIDIILTVHAYMHGIVKKLCDRLATAGVAGQDHITAYIALDATNMELLFKFLHNDDLLMFCIFYLNGCIITYFGRNIKSFQKFRIFARKSI